MNLMIGTTKLQQGISFLLPWPSLKVKGEWERENFYSHFLANYLVELMKMSIPLSNNGVDSVAAELISLR